MPEFPVDLTLQEARAAIEGRLDLRELDGGDHAVFVYFLGQGEDLFPDPEGIADPIERRKAAVRREMRGIVFSKETGLVISRRFHKFFNINEIPESREENLDLSGGFILTEKLDGSMIAPYYTRGQLRFGTKAGLTDTGFAAEQFIDSSPLPYRGFSSAVIGEGWTPIFEWCSRKSRVVLDYPVDSLALVACRHLRTGQYMPYDLMAERPSQSLPSAGALALPVVRRRVDLEETARLGLPHFYATIRQQTGLEGFVFRFEGGQMYKIKTSWYFTVNHALDKFKNPNERHKWGFVLNGTLDDLLPWIGPRAAAAVNFAHAIFTRIQEEAQRMVARAAEMSGQPRPALAAFVNQQPGPTRRLWWRLLSSPTSEAETASALKQLLLSNLASPAQFLVLQELLGIYWADFVKDVPEDEPSSTADVG